MHSIKEALGVRGKDEPAPDAAMKWGISPDKCPPPVYSKPEEEYTPEERAERQKQREKGVDPDLKVSKSDTEMPKCFNVNLSLTAGTHGSKAEG